MFSACASGCVVRAAHLESCSDSECWGCVPRMAETGVLCDYCFQRLVSAVVDVPVLHRHMLEMGRLGTRGGQVGEVSVRSFQGSRVLVHPALLDAADLASLLGEWADQIVENHQDIGHRPSLIGWQTSEPIFEKKDSEIASAVYRISASQSAVESMVRWMLPHMAWLRRQLWSAEMLDSLAYAVSTARSKWPVEERSHYVPMPCPFCRQRALVYTPPAEFQASAIVACDNPECGHMWLDGEWTKTVELALERPDLVMGEG